MTGFKFKLYFSNYINESRGSNFNADQQCLLENLLLFDESKDLNKCKLVNVVKFFCYSKPYIHTRKKQGIGLIPIPKTHIPNSDLVGFILRLIPMKRRFDGFHTQAHTHETQICWVSWV